jgi:hypothetical protein
VFERIAPGTYALAAELPAGLKHRGRGESVRLLTYPGTGGRVQARRDPLTVVGSDWCRVAGASGT